MTHDEGRDPTVLSAEGLRVARGKRVLIESIDLRVDRGEVVVLLGPNGVGKSTLLSVLGGLLPAAGGEVHRHGRVATSLQAPALARYCRLLRCLSTILFIKADPNVSIPGQRRGIGLLEQVSQLGGI